MAEQEGAEDTGAQQINAEDTGPQFGLIMQYVKDLSFENPNSPSVYQWQSQPQIEVQVNIGAESVGEGVHEVVLKLDVTASAPDGVAFKVDLLYAGLFAARNAPDEQLYPFLLAEAPRLLFPFARRMIADSVRDGGFPPLLLDPIDFGALYMQRAAQAQAEQGQSQAPEVTGQA
ncbi:MAG TPA: protein-export chaperone SecB [Allosphingosinicella sp.]|nr:protein-export chaperone SecB [Allosphingosinicella sp.]